MKLKLSLLLFVGCMIAPQDKIPNGDNGVVNRRLNALDLELSAKASELIPDPRAQRKPGLTAETLKMFEDHMKQTAQSSQGGSGQSRKDLVTDIKRRNALDLNMERITKKTPSQNSGLQRPPLSMDEEMELFAQSRMR